jgi:hypothetical protein
MWYDREGKPLVTAEVGTPEYVVQMKEVEKLLSDPNYKVVKQEYTPKKQFYISTIWLGLDHSFGGVGKPVVFETMVFSGRKDKWFVMGGRRRYHRSDFDQNRYCTEEEALIGHEVLLKEYTKKEGKL